ncbi:MAG: hypothetical protein ACRC8S_10965 [Fimbriiglobus sp.]
MVWLMVMAALAPIPASERLKALEKETGLQITSKLDASKHIVPGAGGWLELEAIARNLGGRLTVLDGGKSVRLEAGLTPVSQVVGEFRLAVKQVLSRRDSEAGKTITEVLVEVHWLPRLPVFRLDSAPDAHFLIPAKTAALGSAKVKVPVARFSQTVSFRLEGPPRATTHIDLQGTLTATLSEQMLVFRETNLATPKAIKQGDVQVELGQAKKYQTRWELPVTLSYPILQTEFESFESGVWLSRNRLQLFNPRGEAIEPISDELREGKDPRIVYRFPLNTWPATFEGWSAVYETPTPPIDRAIPFALKKIALP